MCWDGMNLHRWEKMPRLRMSGNVHADSKIPVNFVWAVGGAGSLCWGSAGTQLTLHDVLLYMIAESDHTATNMIINLVGIDTVNDYIHREGYDDTSLQCYMMDMAAVQAGRKNYTSVQNLGEFFTRLYKRQCVGGSYDDEMLDFLLRQTDQECFPSVLTNRQIAHKTGELVGLYDDAGIIYRNGSDYILSSWMRIWQAGNRRCRPYGILSDWWMQRRGGVIFGR